MTYSPDYAAFVASRLKDGGDILKTVTPEKANLLHLALGVSGETGEFIEGALANETSNCKEEIGDLLFFHQGIANYLEEVCEEGGNIEEYLMPFRPLSENLLAMAVWSGNIVDIIKKHVIYNKPLDHLALRHAVRFHISLMGACCGNLRISMEASRKDNIEKLMKRYATGYSDHAAQVRADK